MPDGGTVYIGEGVYASFDGYQIWLAANHHENKVIALEPKVMENLINYAAKVFGRQDAENSDVKTSR
jgi:hypothetical protein